MVQPRAGWARDPRQDIEITANHRLIRIKWRGRHEARPFFLFLFTCTSHSLGIHNTTQTQKEK